MIDSLAQKLKENVDAAGELLYEEIDAYNKSASQVLSLRNQYLKNKLRPALGFSFLIMAIVAFGVSIFSIFYFPNAFFKMLLIVIIFSLFATGCLSTKIIELTTNFLGRMSKNS